MAPPFLNKAALQERIEYAEAQKVEAFQPASEPLKPPETDSGKSGWFRSAWRTCRGFTKIESLGAFVGFLVLWLGLLG